MFMIAAIILLPLCMLPSDASDDVQYHITHADETILSTRHFHVREISPVSSFRARREAAPLHLHLLVGHKRFLFRRNDNLLSQELREKIKDNVNFYQDVKRGGSVAVHSEKQVDGTFKRFVEGYVTMGQKDYAISPHPQTKRFYSKRSHHAAASNLHSVSRIKRKPVNYEDDAVREVYEGHGINRMEKRGSGTYTVELFYLLDPGLSERFPSEADQYYYVAHITNGIDLRYKSISGVSWSITIKCVGMELDKSGNIVNTAGKRALGPYMIDASGALEAVSVYANKMAASGSYPNFDHVMYLSKNDLTSNNHQSTSVAGKAYSTNSLAKASVCTVFKYHDGRPSRNLGASVVESPGALGCINTAAHELGHNLGSAHDYSSGCDDNDKFLMAASGGMIDDNNKDNVGKFSSCSVDQFDGAQASGAWNCLENAGSHFVSESEWADFIDVAPGSKWTMNEQCVQYYGSGYEACLWAMQGDAACHHLWCGRVGTNRCSAGSGLVVAPGTPCASGGGKVCKNLKCQ